MADLSRLNDFSALPPNSIIFADDVDEEFDQLVAGHNAQEDALEILGTYRTLLDGGAFATGGSGGGGMGAGTWLFPGDGGNPHQAAVASVGRFQVPVALYLAAADYTITGKVPKLRLRAQAYTAQNAGNTLTVGLHEITSVNSTGSTVGVGYVVGAAVPGSTVPFVAPGVFSRNQGSSGDFSLPTDGFYALCVVSSAGMAVETETALRAQLQLRHV